MTVLDYRQIRRLAKDGLTIPQIAEKIGQKYNTVAVAIQRHGIKTARHKNGRGCSASTKEAIRLYESGISITEIARRLGRTHANVSTSLRRQGVVPKSVRLYSDREDREIREAIEQLAKKLKRKASHIVHRAKALCKD